MTGFARLAGMKSCWTLLVAGLFLAPAAVSAADRIADLHEVVHLFEADHNTVQRAYEMRWSATSSDRFEKLYQEWLKSLQGTNFSGLEQQAKIDFLLLRNELNSDLDRLSLQRQR